MRSGSLFRLVTELCQNLALRLQTGLGDELPYQIDTGWVDGRPGLTPTPIGESEHAKIDLGLTDRTLFKIPAGHPQGNHVTKSRFEAQDSRSGFRYRSI